MKRRIANQAIACLAAWLLAFNSVASQSVLASALSRSNNEGYAPSQIGTDPVAPLLVFGGMPLAFGVSPYLFVAMQNAASLAQAARNTSNSRVSALGAAAIGVRFTARKAKPDKAYNETQ